MTDTTPNYDPSVTDHAGNGRAENSPGRLAMIEILLVAGLFCAINGLLEFEYAGALGIAASTVLITALLLRRGQGWSSLGLKFPTKLSSILTGLCAAILVMISAVMAATAVTALIAALPGSPMERTLPDVSTLHQYLVLMGIVWTTAAIGEELVFRGFLMTRLWEVFGSSRLAWAPALIFHAVLFGLVHNYQGWAGIILTGAVGFVFGLWYLIGRRNLLPLIFAHGVVNSIGITVLHLQATGVFPESA